MFPSEDFQTKLSYETVKGVTVCSRVVCQSLLNIVNKWKCAYSLSVRELDVKSTFSANSEEVNKHVAMSNY